MVRFFYLMYILGKYSFLYLSYLFKFNKKPKSQFLKNFFEEAGGAFIKFGQILALRIDVLPKEYSLDLIDLFDHTRAFPYKEVEQIFKEELGDVPEKIFKVFEKEPFASASFAQVHAAKLSKNETVVVKIQRPGIINEIYVDFFIIDLIAIVADLFFKIDAMPWREFANEFKHWTVKELDYFVEAENMEKIYNNLAKQNITSVVIPKIYHRFLTKRIIVQEYINGVPLSRVLQEMRKGNLNAAKLKTMGIDIKKTPRTMIEEMQREYFIDGFFHADPHPGNILLLDNGRIGLIDFGIVGESAPRRNEFMKFCLAGAKSEYEDVASYFLKFAGGNIEQTINSILPASVDQKNIEGFMKILSKHFLEYSKQVEKQVRKDLEVMKIDYTTMVLQTLKFVQRYQVKLPKQMMVFIRALSIISFLAKEMDYSFSMSEEVVHFFEKYPEQLIKKLDTAYIPYRRMNKEEALEQFNNWLSYLAEVDQKLFNVVKRYMNQYNFLN